MKCIDLNCVDDAEYNKLRCPVHYLEHWEVEMAESDYRHHDMLEAIQAASGINDVQQGSIDYNVLMLRES